ncbi:NUDIX hydrolase [Microbacterium sp. ZXX196]|uniref:NUDIX hydrolase n=1 Tax=Microbacterium sp. ZXX196 TaxID=2609291 RepID=UPI0012B814CD|nr:NUDIX domain-containing protein [Microbacterium sp. ZXX196]MTE23262.1 NUDIX domain-containing protein [Microbacterium sp. ZXX196]
MDVLSELRSAPACPARDRFLTFAVDGGEEALWKGLAPEHLTASCFVFSPDGAHILLSHHRKGGFWVQFGGHLERRDATLAGAARREAREESGIPELELALARIVDLERHALGGGFACAAHWDVGFVAIAPEGATVAVSAESLDVRWFDVTDLPATSAPGLAPRIATARAALG